MKRYLLWAVLLGLGSAHAQELQFGVKIGLDLPQVVGIAVRSDFEQFGLRATLGGIAGGYTAEAHVYTRLLVSPDGSSGYVGLGVGAAMTDIPYICRSPVVPANSFDSSSASTVVPSQECTGGYLQVEPILSGLIGYEWALSAGLRAFAELRPTYQLNPPSGIRPWLILPLFGVGIQWWF